MWNFEGRARLWSLPFFRRLGTRPKNFIDLFGLCVGTNYALGELRPRGNCIYVHFTTTKFAKPSYLGVSVTFSVDTRAKEEFWVVLGRSEIHLSHRKKWNRKTKWPIFVFCEAVRTSNMFLGKKWDWFVPSIRLYPYVWWRLIFRGARLKKHLTHMLSLPPSKFIRFGAKSRF